MSRGFKQVWKVITNIVAAVILILAVLLVGVRLFGYTPFVVLSGSMEPAYPTGSLIYVKKAAPEAVQPGDPITFKMSSGAVATHRVVEIDPAGKTFTTKGDANNAADASPVPYGSLIGKPVFCVPHLGFVSGVLTQPPGMYLSWSALAILVLLLLLPELLTAADRADKRDAEKEPKKKGEKPKGII